MRGSSTVASIPVPTTPWEEGYAYTDERVGEHVWDDGWRRLDGGEDRYRIDVVSKSVYMQGGGYWGGWDGGLGRGVYRGEELVEDEVWDITHPTKVFDESGRTEIPSARAVPTPRSMRATRTSTIPRRSASACSRRSSPGSVAGSRRLIDIDGGPALDPRRR